MSNYQQHGLQNKVMIAGAVLMIIASVIFIVYRWQPHPSGNNRALNVGLGQAVAVETAKVFHEHGRVVVIRAPEHAVDNMPENDMWRAFCAEMERYQSILVVTTVVVNSEPPMEYGLTRTRLDSILEQQPEIDGVVSLYGIAEWDPRHPFELPRADLKIVAVQRVPYEIEPYFVKGSLAAAIVPRSMPNPDRAKPQTPSEWFERYYQVYTVENYRSRVGEAAQ